jgi:hypothetical protein
MFFRNKGITLKIAGAVFTLENPISDFGRPKTLFAD